MTAGKPIRIGDSLIGNGHPAFIIAEIGCNHNGSIEMAKELVEAAREAGCDCVKLTTFRTETFCSEKDKLFTYQSRGETITESMFSLFKRLEFDEAQWAEMTQFCKDAGVPVFSTIQDEVDLNLMVGLGLEAIKVGSDDFDHLDNLVLYAKTGLPLVLSKGMANQDEVDTVIDAVSPHTDKLIILHCVSIYPATPEQLNLRQIPALAARHPDIVWGFSDHSQGATAAITAVSLGAKVIEKHFTLDHDLEGPDHWFSADPQEMAQLVLRVRECEAALGDGVIAPHPDEVPSKAIMRRRVVAIRDLPAGARLEKEMVAFKRADNGVFLSDWPSIRGRELTCDVQADIGLELADFGEHE
jgi:N-acetylneuraminate synthase/N,N'-diacetyllegionaminate synthase